MMKPKVAFVCVHNACRSQIAEALGHALAGDVFESYSAGTSLKATINPDAVRLMKRLYGIDMEKNQHPKLLEALPPVDVVITMGCGVSCPSLPCQRREDWGLDDPTGQPNKNRNFDTMGIKVAVLSFCLKALISRAFWLLRYLLLPSRTIAHRQSRP